MSSRILAIDLGATSGRVIEASVGPDHLSYEVVHRFANGPVETPEGLKWDITGLFEEILVGLKIAGKRTGTITSIGVDSWAVDYGLLSAGVLLSEPFHYRDARTERGVEKVHRTFPFPDLFSKNGLQFLPINTLYQLATEEWDGGAGDSEVLLMIPDLINFWLTGEQRAEITNASTSGLLDVETGEFSPELVGATGARMDLFPPLINPGQPLGALRDSIATEVGFSAPVVSVGSHDTASAVVAAPMRSASSAYISCGTWGLVGVEVARPILTDAAREANFTNERGVDGRIRFLHNVMGLWLLNESVAHWNLKGDPRSVEEFVEAAHDYSGEISLFDVNDPVFMAPGDIPSRIRSWCQSHGVAHVDEPVAIVASIIQSLASAMALAVHTAGSLCATTINEICMVGGGSAIADLCQSVANHAGIPVVAGPVEATAVGNILVQARAAGLISGDLQSMRALVRSTADLVSYQPMDSEGSTHG